MSRVFVNMAQSRGTLSAAVTTAIGASRWRVVLLAGVVGVVSGVVSVVYPDPTFAVIAACLATYLLALIAARLPAGGALAGLDRAQRLVGTLLTVLAVIAVFVLVDAEAAATLAITVGFMAYVIVSLAVGTAIADRYVGTGKLLAFEAITDLLVGTGLVLWAREDVEAVAIVMGIYLVLRGVLDVVIAFTLRTLAAEPSTA